MANDKPSACQQQTRQTTSQTRQTTFQTRQTTLQTGQTRMSLQLDNDETMSDEEFFEDAEEGVVPMEPHPPAPPPSHHMTSAMGLNTHRIQVMKASFFGAGDGERRREGGWERGRVQPPLTRGRTGGLLASQLSQTRVGMEQRLGRVQFRDTPSPIPHLPPDSTPSLSFHHLRSHPTPVPTPSHSLLEFAGEDGGHSMQASTLANDLSTSRMSGHSGRGHHTPLLGLMQVQSSVLNARSDLNTLVPVSDSMVRGRSRMVADAGLFLGRSFRVGWGPNWTLAHSGSEIHAGSSTGQGTSNFSIHVVIEKVSPTSFMVNAPLKKVSVSGNTPFKIFYLK